MKFIEFRETHDHYGAYEEWLSVAEAKASGLIPERFIEYFPNECECGSENMIKNNLRQVTCCDPKCYLKEACCLSEFLTRSNVSGFGEATCATILEKFRAKDKRAVEQGAPTLFKTGSFLDIFDVPESDWPLDVGSDLSHKFAVANESLRSDNITFPELISRLGINSIGGNALKLFNGISSSRQLMSEIEKSGGVKLFCYSRGAYAPDLINNLYESLIDIANAERLFHKSMRVAGLMGVDICITGSNALNGVSLTKNELVQVLNDASVGESGQQYFEFHMCSALKSASFILYTVPSSSSKFNAGLARGNIEDFFGVHPVLMQIDEFYEFLRNKVKELDKEI